jgi:HEAT repeat protein
MIGRRCRSEGETMNRQTRTGVSLESLVEILASRDGLARQRAREALVAEGRAAVPLLIRALRESRVDQVRWEAAKALGTLDDARAIPVLVAALEDDDPDVGWLAAEALQKLGKAAWPAVLRALLRRGARSAVLRQAVHHVFRNQREPGFETLIEDLLKALEIETLPSMVTTTAHAILEKMDVPAEEDATRRLR